MASSNETIRFVGEPSADDNPTKPSSREMHPSSSFFKVAQKWSLRWVATFYRRLVDKPSNLEGEATERNEEDGSSLVEEEENSPWSSAERQRRQIVPSYYIRYPPPSGTPIPTA
ncbi:UNVERIFIED_CONTAM: hypothetical protein Sradi_6676700 [Sesamum radiatum]|uniref:Uncharacterized protein n=1 Tax=Sesamum radiatum TaxID=300843 RepID=A0AAW2JRC8_SESRA